MKEKNMSKTNQQVSSSSFKARFLYDLYTYGMNHYEGTDYAVTDDQEFIERENNTFENIEKEIDLMITDYAKWKDFYPYKPTDDYMKEHSGFIDSTFRFVRMLLFEIRINRVSYHQNKMLEKKEYKI